jgi:hypothetical protein
VAELTYENFMKALKEAADEMLKKQPLWVPIYNEQQKEFLKRHGIDPTFTIIDEVKHEE